MLELESNILNACVSLNAIGSYKLIKSGIIRRCGFDGMGMALLEEVCHSGGRL